VKLEITKFDQRENEIEAFWKFSCILDLPWKPLLAAAGMSLIFLQHKGRDARKGYGEGGNPLYT
jgi:hypothetical protein